MYRTLKVKGFILINILKTSSKTPSTYSSLPNRSLMSINVQWKNATVLLVRVDMSAQLVYACVFLYGDEYDCCVFKLFIMIKYM